MTANMRQDLIDDIVAEVSAAQPTPPPKKAAPPPPPQEKKEEEETLEQLESDWRMKTNEPERATRTVYDEHAKPFLKKEELYDYWRDDSVTEPYIIVAVENLFGVPHELWRQVEDDIHAIEKIPVRLLQQERIERQLEFFNRVLSTASITKDVNPQFVADYRQVQYNRLHELASMRYAQERREHAEEERSRNDFYKKNRFRR